MSVPKQLAKRIKLEKKRARKREIRRARQQSLGSYGYEPDGFDPPGPAPSGFGGVKMSEVLMDFVAPEIDSSLDKAALKRLYSMAQAAWNIALQPAGATSG